MAVAEKRRRTVDSSRSFFPNDKKAIEEGHYDLHNALFEVFGQQARRFGLAKSYPNTKYDMHPLSLYVYWPSLVI